MRYTVKESSRAIEKESLSCGTARDEEDDCIEDAEHEQRNGYIDEKERGSPYDLNRENKNSSFFIVLPSVSTWC